MQKMTEHQPGCVSWSEGAWPEGLPQRSPRPQWRHAAAHDARGSDPGSCGREWASRTTRGSVSSGSGSASGSAARPQESQAWCRVDRRVHV